jgi:hypothetical protein
MFTPNKTMKKILSSYKTNVRIWEDGIVIEEEKEIKIAKDTTTAIFVNHFFPMKIKFYAHDFSNIGFGIRYVDVKTITINSRMLVHGFEEIRIEFNLSSIASTARDIYFNKVTITDPEGGINEAIWLPNLTTGNVKVYPDPTCMYDSNPYLTAKEYLLHSTLPLVEHRKTDFDLGMVKESKNVYD